MRNYTSKVLLFGLALLGLGTASYHRPEPQAPAVTNRTRTVEVIALLPAQVGYDLMLKNVSAKNINGYSVGLERGGSRTVDLSVGDQVIPPGDQFTVNLPQGAAKQCTLRYVTFDDDTADGDAAAITELQDRRAGRREQLERIVPLLSAGAASIDVEQLKAQLQALPEEAAEGRSLYAALGMRDAKQDALMDLKKLDRSNVQAGLSRLVEQNSRLMMRLQKRTNP
jgi:hypothetical protein